MARILSEPAGCHCGREHALITTERYTHAEVAQLLSEQPDEPVSHVDGDEALRDVTGDDFDRPMTRLRHETQACHGVTHQETVSRLLGRPQQTLRDYIAANRQRFR